MTGKRPTLRDCIRALRGALHLGKRRYEQALTDFDRAIELDPGEDDYIMKRAEIQRLIGPAEPTVLLTAHQMALTCGATAPPPWLGTHWAHIRTPLPGGASRRPSAKPATGRAENLGTYWAQTAVEDQSQP
jgi:hypothetical protein